MIIGLCINKYVCITMMYFSAFHILNEETHGLSFEDKVDRGLIKILHGSYYADLNKEMTLCRISGSQLKGNTSKISVTDTKTILKKK